LKETLPDPSTTKPAIIVRIAVANFDELESRTLRIGVYAFHLLPTHMKYLEKNHYE